MTERTMLSYGAGVNSTALLLLLAHDPRLAELRQECVVTFCDTGAEMPETYEYIAETVGPFLEAEAFEFHVLGPEYRGGDKRATLEQYSLARGMIPHRTTRFCTVEWKLLARKRFAWQQWGINPRKKATWVPAVTDLIGMAADEPHRAKPAPEPYFSSRFPLIELGIDREGCNEIIRAHGWEPPRKSGCFFCPYAKRSHFIDLALTRPALFERAVAVEAAGKHFAEGHFLIGKRSLPDTVAGALAQGTLPTDGEMFGEWERAVIPCGCGE